MKATQKGDKMQVKSAIGGHWDIDVDPCLGQVWTATHSSYVPDWDPEFGSGIRFHQQTSAATLEELYVAIGELEADALETALTLDGHGMDPAQVEMIVAGQRPLRAAGGR